VRLYDHLQSLPLAFFQKRRHGDTLALLTHDVYVVSGYAGATLLAVVPMLLVVAGAAIAMLRIDARLALLALLMIPLFYLALKLLGRHLRPLASQMREEDALAVAIAEENLGMLPAIKTFTREEAESGRFGAQVGRASLTADRQLRASVWLGPLLQFVASAAVIGVLWLAASRVAQGGLTAESLVAFLLYGQLTLRPVAGLANVYGQTLTARASLARLLGALDEAPEEADAAGATLPPVRGAIAFENVSFAYPGRPPALESFNLNIAAGETLGLIGPNGAGKSTLVHLLLRLYRPDAGRVTIDGIDIAGVSLASLRAQVGLVPQHVLLFNASVRDNIAYGRPDPTDAEIEAAARAARAHDFIAALPDGYSTLIGDRGVRLSGGQQQRVALARALLKDPPILVMDEATAMFDPEGEADFLAECADILRTRTVILITHRPASLAVADRIHAIK
jgi:subfamily B ATP-binding cassette protein MsbA